MQTTNSVPSTDPRSLRGAKLAPLPSSFLKRAINLTLEEEPQAEITVGGQEVNVLIDSGASCNVIDQQLWEQLRQKEVVCKSQAVNKTLKSCGTVKKVEVIAKFWCKVELGVKSLTDVEFFVKKGKGRLILGKKNSKEAWGVEGHYTRSQPSGG